MTEGTGSQFRHHLISVGRREVQSFPEFPERKKRTMSTPVKSLKVSRLVGAAGTSPDDLPGDWRVGWEERAAILEYDGGHSREHAEAVALT